MVVAAGAAVVLLSVLIAAGAFAYVQIGRYQLERAEAQRKIDAPRLAAIEAYKRAKKAHEQKVRDYPQEVAEYNARVAAYQVARKRYEFLRDNQVEQRAHWGEYLDLSYQVGLSFLVPPVKPGDPPEPPPGYSE